MSLNVYVCVCVYTYTCTSVSPIFSHSRTPLHTHRPRPQMVRLAISTVELKLTCRLTPESDPLFLRFIASNPTGFVLKVHQYCEAAVGGRVLFKAVSGGAGVGGPLDGLPASTPYEVREGGSGGGERGSGGCMFVFTAFEIGRLCPRTLTNHRPPTHHPPQVTERFEQQRAQAMTASDTLYAYDWPVLFEAAAERLWEEFAQARGGAAASSSAASSSGEGSGAGAFRCRELVMCDAATLQPLPRGWTAQEAEARGALVPSDVEPGLNDCGMVAWLVTYRSPEYPLGRDVVLVANDITKEAGRCVGGVYLLFSVCARVLMCALVCVCCLFAPACISVALFLSLRPPHNLISNL